MSYSGSLSLQSKLVARENGHICNANHVSDSTDVVYDTFCSSCNNAFGPTSNNSINKKVASTSCTSIAGNGNPIPIPTLSPVGSPTPRPSVALTTPALAPTPHDSTCNDDPLFRFQWRGSQADFNYVARLSNGYRSKVCRNSGGNDCRNTCGNGP
jgi:hypothetical protein